MPSLMHFYIDRWFDPPIWADRRMRRFATEGPALWQSQCYLKGEATCISCHMPPTTHMIKDYERDHTISIPVPDNTALYQIPNACNTCHFQETAQWSMQWMDRWYPSRPKPNLRRAKAFTLARKRSPASIDLLVGLLRDPAESTVVRGSAAGFLGEFKGVKVAAPLIEALSDPDIMVRAEAARSLSEVRSEKAIASLTNTLYDPNRIVRPNSIFALIKMGILRTDGEHAAAFDRARGEYEGLLHSFPDVYSIRVDLGTYLAIRGDYEQALVEYKYAVNRSKVG